MILKTQIQLKPYSQIGKKELAMQFISNDKTVRSNTVQDFKDLNSQSLATQAKRSEQIFSLILVSRKIFDLMVDDIVELSTENES